MRVLLGCLKWRFAGWVQTGFNVLNNCTARLPLRTPLGIRRGTFEGGQAGVTECESRPEHGRFPPAHQLSLLRSQKVAKA